MEPQRPILGQRNQVGLDQHQIEQCLNAWHFLDETLSEVLDVSQAHHHSSRTCYSESTELVMLGADAYPGAARDARSSMSLLACLAHELSHAQRHRRGYNRPTKLPDSLLDEAEASLNASFYPVLGRRDRTDLIDDARDRLTEWLAQAAESEHGS